MTDEPYKCFEDNAEQIWAWLQERGGICIWRSINLSDPGRTWTTPMKGPEGEPPSKPHWGAEKSPGLTITDPKEVVVVVPREYKRFKIALRRGAQGMMIKLTDHASRKVQTWCAKATEQCGDSWYVFEDDQAVILVPDKQLPIVDYMAQKEKTDD